MCKITCYNCIHYAIGDCAPYAESVYEHYPDWFLDEQAEVQAEECACFKRKCDHCKWYDEEDQLCRLDK